MAENSASLPFESLLSAIAQLGIHEKMRLRELLDTAIVQDSLEDAEDIADAKVALAEPGGLSLAEFKQELGLS